MTTIELTIREFRRSVAFMAVFALATNLLLLIQPLYLLQIYDRVIPSRSQETLVFLTLIAGVGLGVLGLLEVVRSILANRAAARLDTRLSDLTLRTIIRFGSMTGGNTQPLRDIATLRGLLSSKLAFAVLDLPFATIFIALMYFIHPALFWLTLAGAAAVSLIALANQLVLARVSAKQAAEALKAGRQSEQLTRNADSIMALGMLENVVDKWGGDHAASLALADKASTINAWFAGLSRIVRLGLQMAILGYGAYLVLTGEMTAGLIFAASLISGRGLQPIDQIIGSWRQLVAGWEAWKRVRGLLRNVDKPRDRTSMPAPKGRLEAANVFQPNPADPSKPPILRGVSFEVEPGQALAIVGPSGAGKSTLARLIVGAMPLRTGNIRIDGHDIANWDPEELGRHMGYLAQDVELIPGTIAENISRFEPGASDEAIVTAARRSHADDIIQRMPDGYDTFVGPGGLRLSGGERQRVGLARALFGEPRILVLDEPNANLDTAGEQALVEALNEAKANEVTVVFITQRTTLLSVADKIMRMEGGMLAPVDAPIRPAPGQTPGVGKPGTPPYQPPAGAASRFVPTLRASVEQKK